jgi:hypothetical protein
MELRVRNDEKGDELLWAVTTDIRGGGRKIV